MKRRDREINIFSMSALDLFASAMGAFILITLILMPYYLKSTPPVEPTTEQQCPLPQPACPICPTPQPVEIPECPEPTVIKEIVDNLLVIQMEWNKSGVDMDLHVKGPDGEFYYSQRKIPGKPGKLTLDNQSGGADSLEIWMAHNPTPGKYVVYFKLYSGSISADAWGRIDKPSGPVPIPRRLIQKSEGKVKVLEFTITRDYEFQLN